MTNTPRYYDIGGNKYPSVTSVCGVIAKPALYGWYGKHGTKTCQQLLDESAQIGTALHSSIQQYYDHALTKSTSPAKSTSSAKRFKLPPLCKTAWSNFRAFNRQYPLRPLFLEYVVYSDLFKYAGCLDGLFEYFPDGPKRKPKTILIDWKTSGSIYPEYALQVEAYGVAAAQQFARLSNDAADTAMAKQYRRYVPDEYWIVRLDKHRAIDFDKDIQHLQPDESRFIVFLSALNLFNYLHPRKDEPIPCQKPQTILPN